MVSPEIIQAISKKYDLLQSELDERSRRLLAETKAIAIGHGGVKAVASSTGIAEGTIRIGKNELKPADEFRRQGPRIYDFLDHNE